MPKLFFMGSAPTADEAAQGGLVDSRADLLRLELANAAVRAIRQRGSEAFGILLVGFAYVLVVLLALVLLLSTCQVFGIELTPVPVTIMSASSGGLGWAICGRTLDSR